MEKKIILEVLELAIRYGIPTVIAAVEQIEKQGEVSMEEVRDLVDKIKKPEDI